MIKLSDLTITIRARPGEIYANRPVGELGRIGAVAHYIVYPEPFASRMLQLARIAQNKARKRAEPKAEQ